MNRVIAFLGAVFLLLTTHAYAVGAPDCKVLMSIMGHASGSPSALTPTQLAHYFGKGPSDLGRASQVLGVMLRFDGMNGRLQTFQQGLPTGAVTPRILETHMQMVTDEFALLPTTDAKELARIKETRAAAASLLLNPHTPPAIRQRLAYYTHTIGILGLEPGLPFTQLVRETEQLIAN